MASTDMASRSATSNGFRFLYHTYAINGREKEPLICSVIIVEFSRLLIDWNETKLSDDITQILLFSTLALLGYSLPDMTAENLLQTISQKGSRSILMLKNLSPELEEDLKSIVIKQFSSVNSKPADLQSVSQPEISEETHKPLAYKVNCIDKDTSSNQDEADLGDFEGIYTDDSSGGEEECTDGLNLKLKQFAEFVSNVRKNKKENTTSKATNLIEALIGVSVFEKSYRLANETTCHLQLIAVRKKYRKRGVGASLIKLLKDPVIVGDYDSIATYADSDAIPFFKRHGFVDDVVLNMKYKDITDNWLNSTPMCYVPLSVPGSLLNARSTLPETDPGITESSFNECPCFSYWHGDVFFDMNLSNKSQGIGSRQPVKEAYHLLFVGRNQQISAYQSHLVFSMKMLQQLRMLQGKVQRQQEVIDYLKQENYELKRQRTENEYTVNHSMALGNESAQDDASLLSFHLRYGIGDEKQIRLEFMEDMMKSSKILFTNASVEMSPMSNRAPFERRRERLEDPSLYTVLYFCGGSTSDELQAINADGFSPRNFSAGDYGLGLYFASSARKACQYSLEGAVLLALVGLGITQSVVTSERHMTKAPEGHDSLLTMGRRRTGDETELSEENQEFVIFHCDQATPICIIWYQSRAI